MQAPETPSPDKESRPEKRKSPRAAADQAAASAATPEPMPAPEPPAAAEDSTPGFRMAISRAQYFRSSGILEVTGWSLANERGSEMLLSIPGLDVLAPITPGTELRMDVAEKFPQYGDMYSGWRVRVTLPDLPEGAVVQVSYASPTTIKTFRKTVARNTAATVAAEVKDTLTLEKCHYSPFRCLCTLEGTLSAGIEPKALTVTSSVGRPVTVQGVWTSETSNADLRKFQVQFPLAGVVDGEIFRVRFPDTGLASAGLAVKIRDDSPRRAAALSPAVALRTGTSPEDIDITDLLPLKYAAAPPPRQKVPGSVCYFPPFGDAADLSSHYHRAGWYLGGPATPAKRVTFHHKDGVAAVQSPPEHFARTNLATHGFAVLSEMPGYLEALQSAEMVMVWRPIGKALLAYLSGLLGEPKILTVATDDSSAVEYGNYCRALWLLASPEERAAVLDSSQMRFQEILARQRRLGKTSAAVLGTGPSIDRATEFDFSKTMTVACNTVVASDVLLDHTAPAFITAGDAVSHFGVSRYAEKFREDLLRCLSTRDVYFLTSAIMGYVLIQKHPEIRDKVLLCEQKHNGINLDLTEVWALPRFDSTLNIHMLPIAASFSDTIFLLGLDGKNPDPAANEDFWAHSSLAHYHDLVDTGHACHPTFAVNRAQSTEDRFMASTEDSFSSAECLGKSFYSLAHSFTPAVHARPAPPHVLKVRARSKHLSLAAPAKASGVGKRALITMSMPRRHFSGGRLHATLMAEAMALFCDEVVVWSNNSPPWMADLAACAGHARVRYRINDFLDPPTGDFDYVAVVPSGGPHPAGAQEALAIARRCNARTAFLNFESPNWFNALSPEPKTLADHAGWFAAACFSDVILSSANTAVPFARDFYRTLFHTPEFAAVPPAINSTIANIVLRDGIRREKQIVVISRFGNLSRHKNIDAIFDIFPEEMRGYTVALVAGTSDLPDPATMDSLKRRMEDQGMTLKILHMISDRQKFEEIARSELMVFPSLFEGFGYPPVEAGYMNTPCVAYDLPVLREFNSDHAHFVPTGDAGAMRARIAELLRMDPAARSAATPPGQRKFATLEAFAERLRAVFETDSPARAAQGYSLQKFEMALTVYKDGCQEPRFAYGGLRADEARALMERYLEYSRVIEDTLARLRVLA